MHDRTPCKHNRHNWWQIAVPMVLALTLTACTVELISDYDETLDKAATALQKEIETFIIRMERTTDQPEGLYSANTAFYDSAEVDLSSMLVRAEARPKNKITVDQLKEIIKQIGILEKLHKKAEARGEGLNETKARIVRDVINTSFTALLKLELAKRRE